MSRREKATIGDLFCGAGLFSEAFRQSGAKAQFAIEIDPLAAASYAKNVGNHVSVQSVESTPSTSIPKVDIVVAGPPCQGFSTLGRRDPKDVRNQLCLLVPTWAKHCDAKVVVVENVPPFLESKAWEEMRDAFQQSGYEVAAWCLDASDFGVPQRRRRAFTIASRIGIPQSPISSRGRVAATVFHGIRRNDPMHIWPVNSPLAEKRMRLLPKHGDRRDIMAAAPELCPPSWGRIGCQATDVWGRINASAPTNTIRCDFQNPSKGRYIHPEEPRMISLREGARLQQIPDGWELIGHRTAMTRQIGNGVPLGLGRAVARRVLELF